LKQPTLGGWPGVWDIAKRPDWYTVYQQNIRAASAPNGASIHAEPGVPPMSVTRLVVPPIEVNFSLKTKIYDALKQSIAAMNIYGDDAELRLDERQLSDMMGVSRTPIREAIARLEQEGMVRIVPRKGVFVARKTKREIWR
jgi:hypothetical protein